MEPLMLAHPSIIKCDLRELRTWLLQQRGLFALQHKVEKCRSVGCDDLQSLPAVETGHKQSLRSSIAQHNTKSLEDDGEVRKRVVERVC